jgi:hypothetical protein
MLSVAWHDRRALVAISAVHAGWPLEVTVDAVDRNADTLAVAGKKSLPQPQPLPRGRLLGCASNNQRVARRSRPRQLHLRGCRRALVRSSRPYAIVFA